MQMICDHQGKTSQARVAALAGTFTACALSLAPLWGGPSPDMNLVMVLLAGPGGLALWQKIGAPSEKPQEH